MLQIPTRTFRVGHMACGIGAGARGFNQANPRVGSLSARFECAGGIDVDAGAIRNFERMTGVKGTVMDLFDRDQYRDFHGREAPPEFREATPEDIRGTFGRLDVMFSSYPCKGFSGLLSAKASETVKYQALNRLTLRGMWLTLEAYKDDPIPILLFENVPRIASRGRAFLDEIIQLHKAYGYLAAETVHDCGEIGNLGQSRKRFLLVMRHAAKVPPFLYQPEKFPLRGVGEIIGKLPMPGDGRAGPMHRVPMLQWKTWVRLAFVPAGKDWRALNDLAVEGGVLRDYGIMPERELHGHSLGVCGWDDPAPTITSARAPGQGRYSVADPRPEDAGWQSDVLGVRGWHQPTGTVPGRSSPTNGAHSVADPRVDGHPKSVQLGVRPWDQPAACVKGDVSVGTGPYAVSDPRIAGRPRFNNVFRIVPFEAPSPAVAGPGGAAGGIAVADPRAPERVGYKARKYKVTAYGAAAGTVIAASTTGEGAFAVADPRPTCIKGEGDAYKTQGHYGVVAWDEPSGAVPAYAKNNNGSWSVADPREAEIEAEPVDLPKPNDRLVARIVSTDGTWHRPFTTLELAALQSLFDPDEIFAGIEHHAEVLEYGRRWEREAMVPFDLIATSDATKREWIGNAVPSAAACGMAETIGETLLLAEAGETYMLSSREIWVKPLALALSVDPRQELLG